MQEQQVVQKSRWNKYWPQWLCRNSSWNSSQGWEWKNLKTTPRSRTNQQSNAKPHNSNTINQIPRNLRSTFSLIKEPFARMDVHSPDKHIIRPFQEIFWTWKKFSLQHPFARMDEPFAQMIFHSVLSGFLPHLKPFAFHSMPSFFYFDPKDTSTPKPSMFDNLYWARKSKGKPGYLP